MRLPLYLSTTPNICTDTGHAPNGPPAFLQLFTDQKAVWTKEPVCRRKGKSFPKYSQQNATFLDLSIFTEALHVSGGSSFHH